MEKKRSTGVTVFAILFISLGLISCLNIFNFALWNYKHKELTGTSFKEIVLSDSRTDRRLREIFDDTANEPLLAHFTDTFNEFQNHPIVFLSFLFGGSLGLFGITIGIGIWKLSERSRKLLIWFQMVGIFIVPLFSYFVYMEFFKIFGKNVTELTALQAQRMSLYIPIAIAGIQMLGSLLVCGLIIYYFTRPKVKEQFN